MSAAQRFFDRLTVAVLLRRIITVAELAPTLTDAQLRTRLLALAGMTR